MSRYTLHQFKKLPAERQIEKLNKDGVPLDLACVSKSTEAVLFAYEDFYVEVVVDPGSDEILAIKCFRSMKKLDPYLVQIDIGDITDLLLLNR